MKTRILALFTLASSVALTGCSTTHYSADRPGQPPKLPIRFNNYRDLYAFIEAYTWGDMPTNSDTTLAMASDTTTEIVTTSDDQLPYLFVLAPQYYHGNVFDLLRGAQGNGDYFILRPLARLNDYTGDSRDHGFELVGMAGGNSLTWTRIGGKLGFITTWHVSAAEQATTLYQWDGKIFKPAEPAANH